MITAEERAQRVMTMLPIETTPIPATRANAWGLYLAQHGAASNLPTDFGLGRHAGRHRVERLAEPCLSDIPRARPDGPVALETRPDPCGKCNEIGHYATVRLTADPERGLRGAHRGVHEMCQCCAFPGKPGGLYEEMRGQARTSGHVGVELRQPTGEWI